MHLNVGISQLQTLHLGKETVNLVNLIVNRGREFELARYPEWRKICGLKKLSSFLDIQDLWLPEAYSYITATYKLVTLLISHY